MGDTTEIKTSGFKWRVGQVALFLRDHWILTAAIALAAIALATLPRLALDANGKLLDWAVPLLTGLGIAAALAAVADKLADHHSKQLDKIQLLGQQELGHLALAPMISLLDTVHDGAFVGGKARQELLTTLRTTLATAAAAIPAADDIRATYYPLTRDAKNWRVLKDPKSRGRMDEASSTFLESQDPDHPIWKILDARDTDCEIVSAPDPDRGVNWKTKPYQTFISVPVKVGNIQFGLLSVNAPNVGDLTELDRVAMIALARIMGAVLALNTGPTKLRHERDGQRVDTEEDALGADVDSGYSEDSKDQSDEVTEGAGV
ncbi:hypothetical protein ACFVVC_18995 [Pseudarthrobacter sp. NPDC058196]|uniref:hypothetical protein n=1 Tax=Pseudarthrobacter sp. NPDC058196 TaxID=3346376 RepID=UPI0036D7D0D6